MNNHGELVFLIVEDEESNILVLRMLLQKRYKAEVLCARNGQQGVEIVEKRSDIDLVFMDMKMPVMDGYTATGIIKKMRKDLPVIAITAYGLNEQKNEILNAGCDDYLAKPIQAMQIFDKVEKFLKVTDL
jgi:two-component system sensor histidine kinase EvgS